jgi:soluble lytic murein transglycosylase-like protein
MDWKLDPVRPWTDKIRTYATKYGLDPCLVAGIVLQESSGNTYAIRVERGFWKRYAAGIVALIAKTANKYDDRWEEYPDLASTSYGLMQVLYVVALELGAILRFPTELCDPDVGLDFGCKHLSNKIRQANGVIVDGLLKYNGGGNPDYANEVLAKSEMVRSAKLF